MEFLKTLNTEKASEKKSNNFNNLVIFDSDLNIVKVLSFSNRNLANNIFDENLFYIELEFNLFFKIKSLLKSNKLKFRENPIKEKITIEDIEKTPLPPLPPTPEEAINNGLLDVTMGVGELNMKVHALSDGMLNQVEERSELKKQIEALNNTVLMLTMKLGGR